MMKKLHKYSLLVLLFIGMISVNAQSVFPILPGSTIADGNDNQVLRTWLEGINVVPSGTLLYRRSSNGASTAAFHNAVDNKGATLTIFKTNNGNVFGFFSTASASSTSGYGSSNEAFAFNLTTDRKASIYYPQYSIYNNPNYGPTFGGGHDLQINNTMNGGYLNVHSYNSIDGSAYRSSSALKALTGINTTSTYYSFGAGFITEIEVYAIEFNTSAPNIQGQDITIVLNTNGQASITAQDIDTGTTDSDGPVTLSIDKTNFTCDDLGGNSDAITPEFVGSVNQPTHSHGGGYNPNTNEFWYPQWSGTTVYKYDADHNPTGSFNTGQNQIMQLWMDLSSETDYYTANWGYNTITKRSGSSTIWSYNMGATAVSVSADADYVYAYGAWQNYLRVLDKDTGAFVKNINIPGSIYGYGNLVVANGYIYIAGYANGWSNNPHNYQYVHQLNMDGTYVGSTYSGRTPYNMSFDGETMWISDNGNTINGVKIADGSAYTGVGGSNSVTLTATDPLGNSRSQVFGVTVEDHIAPNISLNGNAQVSVNSDTVFNDPGATPTDNCNAEIEVSGNLDLSTPGVYTLSYKAIDKNGNESETVTREVTVIDATAPIAKAGRVTVELDENGNATVDPASLNNGSTDNGSGTLTFSLDRTIFNCDDLNAEGGSSSQAVNMSFTGTINQVTRSHGGGYNPNTNEFWYPEWAGTNVYVYDENHQYLRTFSTGQIQMMQLWMDTDSETDYYTANWTSNSPYNYTRIDSNGQKVWTYNNANGNYPSGISTDADFAYVLAYGGNRIDVLDKNTGQLQKSINLPGIVYTYGGLVIANGYIYIGGNASGWSTNPNDQRFIHQLDMDGNYINSISTNGVSVYNLAFDGETIWVSQNSNTVSGIKISDGSAYGSGGGVPVTLTVTDNLGNSSTDEGTVVVVDLLAPTITLNDDQTISVPQGAEFIDPGATVTDNCSATIEVTGTVDSSTLGSYTLTYKATDSYGNESDQITRTVNVIEAVPIVITQNIIVQLDGSGNVIITPEQIDNGSNSAAGLSGLTLDISTFDCSNIGVNNVILTATSSLGGSATGTATVTVVDDTVPTVVTQNMKVQLDANGAVSITAEQVNNGSSDNCAIDTMVLDVISFDCSNIGINTVTLTVTDVNGNTSSATANITVEDKIPPTVVTQDMTVQLDANGAVSITAAQVNNGSSDNCAIDTMVLDVISFDCSNMGVNTVTLTVTDVKGNTATATATITVEDKIAPTVVTKNIIINLDENGNVSLTASQINNDSSDNCGIDLMTIDKTNFDCSNVGVNEVTLTVTDVNGNNATETANVTVRDKKPPTVITQNISISLGTTSSVTAEQINNGSTDNCAISSYSLSKTDFSCSDVGTNNVVLTVTDVYGNSATGNAIVTVVDNIVPIVNTQNISIQLDANGTATITPEQINNGSSDNCSIKSISLNTTNFECATVGDNTVVLTVEDINGNTATGTATVTVIDSVPPTVITQNFTLTLDANGYGSIDTSNIDNGSNDACGIASLSLDKTSFDCTNVGDNTVTLTAVDNNNNSSNLTAIVNVIDVTAPVIIASIDQRYHKGKAKKHEYITNFSSTDACSVSQVTGVIEVPTLLDPKIVLKTIGHNYHEHHEHGHKHDHNCDHNQRDDDKKGKHKSKKGSNHHKHHDHGHKHNHKCDHNDKDDDKHGKHKAKKVNEEVKIDFKKNKIEIKSANPQALYDSIMLNGGFKVDSGDLIKFKENKKHHKHHTKHHKGHNHHGDHKGHNHKKSFKMKIKNGKIYSVDGCSLVLIVTAVDPSGNTTVVRRTIGETALASIFQNPDIPTELEIKDVVVYPNPSRGTFQVKISNIKEDTELYLLDITGKIVEQKSIKGDKFSRDIQMNKSNLPNGIYLLKIISKEKTSTKKVIIQRE